MKLAICLAAALAACSYTSEQTSNVKQAFTSTCSDTSQMSGIYHFSYTPINGSQPRASEDVRVVAGERKDLTACQVTVTESICRVDTQSCDAWPNKSAIQGEALQTGFEASIELQGTLMVPPNAWFFTAYLITF